MPEGETRGQYYLLSRVNKSSYFPHAMEIIVLLYRIITNATRLATLTNITCEGKIIGKHQSVIIFERVILQGNLTEYYLAHDRL